MSSGLLFTKRWWSNRSGVNNLTEIDRLIDTKPDHYKALFECSLGQPSCPQQITTQDPYKIRVLGNPAATRYPKPEQWPARTPWDLLISGNQLYIGLGNANNEGPATNAGPVPVLAYSMAHQTFIEETILPEEQIDRFYDINGTLMIPGTDPRQSWDWGNLYLKKEQNRWQQQRSLPRFIHAHALALHKGKLYAGGNIPDAVPKGLGTQRHGSAVAASTDGGITWQTSALGGWRITDFLQINQQLYAMDAFPGPGLQAWLNDQGRQNFYSGVYQLDDNAQWQKRTDLTASIMLPSTALAGKRMATIERSIHWQRHAIYIAAFVAQADSPPLRAAYLASKLELNDVSINRLPFKDATQVWDIEADDKTIWVLTATPRPDGRWLNQVHRSFDGKHWQSMVAFEAPTFAMSFARQDGNIYFGLGGEHYSGVLLELSPIHPAERARGSVMLP